MIYQIGTGLTSIDLLADKLKPHDQVVLAPNGSSRATKTISLPDGCTVSGNHHEIASPTTVFLMAGTGSSVRDLVADNADHAAVKVGGHGNLAENITGVGSGWACELLSAVKPIVSRISHVSGKARWYGLYGGGIPACDGAVLTDINVTLFAAEHCLRLHNNINLTVGGKGRMKLWNRNLPIPGSNPPRPYNGTALNIRDGANHLYQNIDCVGFDSVFGPLNLSRSTGKKDIHGNLILEPWDDGKRLRKVRVNNCTFDHEVYLSLIAGLEDITFTGCRIMARRQCCVNLEGSFGPKPPPQNVRFVGCAFEFHSADPKYPDPVSPLKGNLSGVKETSSCTYQGKPWRLATA